MKCPPEYWIWLQSTLGPGKKLSEIIAHFGDPSVMYAMGKNAWLDSGTINYKSAEKLTKLSPSQSYEIMKDCKDNNWTIVTYDDEDYYPDNFRHLNDPPAVLYVWGDPSVLKNEVCISIVGTRKCSDYGLSVAESLAYSLAEAGATIVSGGALGVDAMAHSGAIKAGGKTVAFLGCGLGCSYLNQNGSLRRLIARNGAVVSEFPPFSPPTKTTFPIRNRLISGLSLGTVIVEAGECSGSLITAGCAASQGRDVFAVPGDVTSSNYFGTNSLIRDGAKAVFSYMDILDEYIDLYGKYLNTDKKYTPITSVHLADRNNVDFSSTGKTTRKYTKEVKSKNSEENIKQDKINEKQTAKSADKTELPSYATPNAKTVFSMLTNEPRIADEITAASGLPIKDVLAALTELEMYQVVVMHSGKRYSLG